MKILNVSHENKKATVCLTSDELVKLGNILYHAQDKDKNDLYYKLRSNIIIARDLAQYGRLDNFCIQSVMECRNKTDL